MKDTKAVMQTFPVEHYVSEANAVLSLEISYEAWEHRPAVINADPDDCHPDEGGIELGDVRLVGVSAESGMDELILTLMRAPAVDDETMLKWCEADYLGCLYEGGGA